MLKEIIETGKTVEEAISAACEKLGCDREDCQWEILDLPKKSFLGLKTNPAKVKVTILTKEAPAIQSQPVLAKVTGASAMPEKPASAPVAQETKAQPRVQQQKPAPSPNVKAEAIPFPKKPPANEQKPTATSQAQSSGEQPSDEAKLKAQKASEYLSAILGQAGLPGDISVEQIWEEGGVCLCIKGEGLGFIIGRRGDTLDSLQYLCGLVANRLDGEYTRITVDCGDYRTRRRATLEALAKKLSNQVIRTGSSRTLEPMNPFERRIIHAAVANIEGVGSISTGDEPNRRVVITHPSGRSRRPRPGASDTSPKPAATSTENAAMPVARTENTSKAAPISDRPDWPDKGAKGDKPDEFPQRRPPYGGNRDRGRDRDRKGGPQGRERRERPPAYQPTKDQPDTPPTEAVDKPLYGKIDLE